MFPARPLQACLARPAHLPWVASAQAARMLRGLAMKRFASSTTKDGKKEESNEQDERTMEMASGEHGQPQGSIIATQAGLFKLLMPLPPSRSSEDSKPQQPTKGESVLFLLHPNQTLSTVATLIRTELLAASDQAPPTTTSPAQSSGIDFKEITFYGRFKDPSDLLSSASSGKTKIASRWALSTELGDFIKDATKDRHFSIAIAASSEVTGRDDNAEPFTIPVRVPTFEQRTHFLRAQLRSVSQELKSLLSIKKECDILAYRDARRFAYAGLGALGAYWFAVYWLTFKVWDWDVMEPITYLCGLTTVGAGYAWFLHHNREVSYRTVFELSTSRRQSALYDQKGFDRERWHDLVDEATTLRRTIQKIARDYDVKWTLNDEKGDHEALEREIDQEEKKAKETHDGPSKETAKAEEADASEKA